MNKEIREVIEICEQWEDGKIPTIKEVEKVAYCDLMPLYESENYEIKNFIEHTFKGVLEKYAMDWDDFDENYPNNPYHIGYAFNGNLYITGYTGAAGRYWNDTYIETICKR